MNRKNLGTRSKIAEIPQTKGQTHPTPPWVPISVTGEKDLCPDCFKVVGERSRYTLVCTLGKAKGGMTVGELTNTMNLKQPTITHHLQILESVNAVESKSEGRTRTYKLNRNAHCFEDCKIPY